MTSTDQAPPPEDTSTGWKPDPLGSGKERGWDGAKWTNNVRTAGGGKRNRPGGLPIWAWVGIVIAGLIVIGIASGSGDDSSNTPTKTPTQTASKPTTNTTTKPTTNTTTKPASDKPKMTPGQENAVSSAEDYLSLSAFSKAGLIDQLSSSAGDGFSRADATYAVNHVDVNWNEQAYKSAKDYLNLSSFSLNGLIGQLSSSAGDQFTQAQAEYGAKKAYNGG